MNKDSSTITTILLNGLYIPPANYHVCLNAINNLYHKCSDNYLNDPALAFYNRIQPESLKRLLPPFMYTKPCPAQGFNTLKEAFNAWRYDINEQGNGLHVHRFLGKQWGCDEVLFHTIAPFVSRPASVHCVSYSGESWVYHFDKGNITEGVGLSSGTIH